MSNPDTPHTGVIGPQPMCNFSSTNIHITELFDALKINNIFESKEIAAMHQIIRKLKSVVPDFLCNCLITLLSTAPTEDKNSFTTQIKLPKNLNYVNPSSELYTFMRYDEMCNFNVYPSRLSIEDFQTSSSDDKYLFGILDVDKIYGCFSLTDENSEIFVKFTPYSKDLYRFKNTLVMIKKWTIFTEVFQLPVPTIKYILINFEDVIIIKNFVEAVKQRLFYGKNEVCQIQAKYSKYFQIIRISEVICGYNNEPECWIEGFVSERGPTRSPRTWVYMCHSNLSIVPFLKEQIVYKLIYNENLKQIYYNPELFRLKNAKQIFKIDRNTIFQETGEIPYLQNGILLESVQEVKNFISRAPENQFFSVSLKISKKQLQKNSYTSWYPKRHQNTPYFGNPDDKHQLRLIFYDFDTKDYLDLYLTNRDNHVTPLGLIENMIVKVKNVQHNKNRYLKTTVFSSFEVLEYCPNIPFSSVNLRFKDMGLWNWRSVTPKTALSLYCHLPLNCIVHGSFLFQAIFDLKITPLCLKCQKRVIAERPCSICKVTKRDLQVDMTIYVQDARNPCFNIDADKEFFYTILGLRRVTEVEYFCNAFYKCDGLQINFCEFANFKVDYFTKDLESKGFLEKLAETIYKHINFKLYAFVNGVCVRQMEHSPWRMIDFEIV